MTLLVTSAEVFDHVTTILYMGGGALAFIGLLRIYKQWNDEGAVNIDKEIVSWIGGCLLCIISAVIAQVMWA